MVSNFGKEDLDYLLKFYQGTGFNAEWAAFALASSYPTLCKAKLDIETSSELLDDWYLPSWREISLVINKTDYNSLLKSACKILEFSLEPVENQWGTKIPLQFWASPSTSQEATAGDFEGDTLYFAAYVTFEKDYKELTMTPPQTGSGDMIKKNDQWNGMGKRLYGVTGHFTPNKMQVLPFREFK